MTLRPIEFIMAPPPPHMVGDGFRVHGFFPGGRIDKKRMSPFFMMDYGSRIEFSPSAHQRGVGVHPHAGFETVTIAYHGRIAHHDSAGNHGIIGEGDVQWMTAGAGILHKEYHEEQFSKEGGLFQMVQLWVNLPAAHKRTQPKYQEITNARMGRHLLADGNSYIEVIAGTFEGTSGPAYTFTPMHLSNARLQKGAAARYTFPAHYNTGMLVVDGQVTIQGSSVPVDHFVLFKKEGEAIDVLADTDATVLVLSGEPINEPIAAYGPFLMNTWQEVEQAIADVNAGKFGVLED